MHWSGSGFRERDQRSPQEPGPLSVDEGLTGRGGAGGAGADGFAPGRPH